MLLPRLWLHGPKISLNAQYNPIRPTRGKRDYKLTAVLESTLTSSATMHKPESSLKKADQTNCVIQHCCLLQVLSVGPGSPCPRWLFVIAHSW